jgi:hypothetical protein
MRSMRRALFVILLCILGFAAGAALVLLLQRPAPPPDAPTIAAQIREVARLETLELVLYKKIAFSPEPEPQDSLWKDVAHWLRFTLRKPEGRAIVFARGRLGLDLGKLDAGSVRVVGQRVELVLPPLSSQVELLPAETEVIGSNLDTAETAQLFDRARSAFLRELEQDQALHRRARASAERSLRALLLTLGFREVVFIEPGPVPVG